MVAFLNFKNEELEDAKKQSHVLLDTTHIYDKIPLLFPKESLHTKAFVDHPVYVTDSLWVDSGLESWTKTVGILEGSHHYLWNFIQQPTHNKEALVARQNTLNNFSNVATKIKKNLSIVNTLELLKTCEKDVLWILNVPTFAEAWPLNLVFPSMPIFKYINYFSIPLTVFQFYKIFIGPVMNIVTPFSALIGPWLYVRKNFKLDISFKAYTGILYSALSQGLKPSGNIKVDSMKYFSLFMYVFFYIYSIVQCFEHAHIQFTVLKNLHEKLQSIRKFIKFVQQLMKKIPSGFLKEFLPDSFNYQVKEIKLPSQMSGMYVLFTDDKLKQSLKSLLQWVYAFDCAYIGYNLINSKKCCKANYIQVSESQTQAQLQTQTQFWNMGHIMLNKQVKNPLSLARNLIITGPNAAGKTTYVRAVCTNSILSQTFGIACALRADVLIVHAIGSFMRIEDSLGQSSLFEAEANRCTELLAQAHTFASSQKHALYFLDEPMHSTPPIEGCATSMAVIEHMGRLPGIRLLVTTHYHDCIHLESMHPTYFQNISMDAYMNEKTERYIFPYKIHNGASLKCIALELLNEKNLPKSLIKRAIVLKNKICNQQVTKSTIHNV